MNLAGFMRSDWRNAWVHDGAVQAYVRKSLRYVGRGNLQTALDIANIQVQESKRGKGLFTAWLAMAERQACLAGKDIVHVESILNPLLYDMLKRRGYEDMPLSNPPSLFKKCSVLKEELDDISNQKD